MTQQDLIVEVEDLRAGYGAVEVLRGIDLTISRGDVVALLGSNGVGKTTFNSVLSGLIRPWAGRIRFNGEDVTGRDAARMVDAGLVLVPEGRLIFPNLTVRENVELAGMREGHEAQIALDVLTRVGLAHIAEQKAGDLAYGHQRLVEIAMGLALNPRLLILDEPTQGLSTAEVEAFISLIRQVAKSTTILLIEHNMQVVMELAHRITVMERGRILAEGTPEEIRSNQAVQQAYLGA